MFPGSPRASRDGVGGLTAGVPGCPSVPRDGAALLLEALSLRARPATHLPVVKAWVPTLPRPLKLSVLPAWGESASRLNVDLLPLLPPHQPLALSQALQTDSCFSPLHSMLP